MDDHRAYVDQAQLLLKEVVDQLGSTTPAERVDAVRRLVDGMNTIQRVVIADAHTSGLSWSEIGSIFGVSRQAAHRRFADVTLVPSDFFSSLLGQGQEDDVPVPSLRAAAKRAEGMVKRR